MVMKNSVSPGRIEGDSGTSAGPGTNSGIIGTASLVLPGAFTKSARASNDSLSNEMAMPIASGQFGGLLLKTDELSDVNAFNNGFAGGSTLVSVVTTSDV